MNKIGRILIVGIFFSSCVNSKKANVTFSPKPIYPIPSEAQMKWQKLETYAFVHFNMNTFTNMEWGMGDESPSLFNPSALDCNQWAKTCKQAGLKGIILTAKHHDGFCLWPSKYTEHSVKNSPWKNGKGDVVRDLADACKANGLKFGVYYSPWDRNHKDYGKPAYIDYMKAQLTELLTEYGDVFEVWFDGANGGTGYYGGANENRKVDKHTYYPWDEINGLVKKLQPNAVIFSDKGPGVRWVGNESGYGYETNWAPLMVDSIYPGMPDYPKLYAKGSPNGTAWVPAETDVSIRKGWYYHAYEDHQVKDLEVLDRIYYESIGRNTSLLINFPVDTRGLIHQNDSTAIVGLYNKIKEDLKINLALNAAVSNDLLNAKNLVDGNFETYSYPFVDEKAAKIEIELKEEFSVNAILLQEYIPMGQRVKEFNLYYKKGEEWVKVHSGTTIGYKRILRFNRVKTKAIKLEILDSRAAPVLAEIQVYNTNDLVLKPKLSRDINGNVSLKCATENQAILYSLNSTLRDQKYGGPIEVKDIAKLHAVCFDPETQKTSEPLDIELSIPKLNYDFANSIEKSFDENDQSFSVLKDGILEFQLKNPKNVIGFTYLPMQNYGPYGFIKEYELWAGNSPNNLVKISEGEFSNIANNPIEQHKLFQENNYNYFKFIAKSTTDNKAATVAEFGLLTKP